MSPLRRSIGIAALTLVVLPLAFSETAHAATPPAAAASTYTVKNGDYLVGIASKLKVKLSDLLATNGLTVDSVILPGQVLNVPAGTAAASGSTATTAPAAAASSPGTYTVQSGDFILGIARRMNVKSGQLLTANDLDMTSVIVPGQKLVVPAGGVIPTDAPATVPTPVSTVAATAAAPTKTDAVVAFARSQLGKGYKFFSAGPDLYDCSGLVTAAFKQVGITLPQYSGLQAKYGAAVDWTTSDIQAGDLVFTYRGGTDPTVISHVGIAISSTQWIHAAGTGMGVITSSLPADSKILAVRRILS